MQGTEKEGRGGGEETTPSYWIKLFFDDFFYPNFLVHKL